METLERTRTMPDISMSVEELREVAIQCLEGDDPFLKTKVSTILNSNKTDLINMILESN